MYIINDICYASQNNDEKKIKSAEVLPGNMLLVQFDTLEKRLFDPLVLKGPVFEPLKDIAVLSDMEIFHGILTWNGGTIDIALETVYAKSLPYDEYEKIFIA